MNLILYNQGKFYGMRNVPELEIDNESSIAWNNCKSYALENGLIDNPELLPQFDFIGKGRLILDNDYFPLPPDLKFEEDFEIEFYRKKVLRLVKVETHQQVTTPDEKLLEIRQKLMHLAANSFNEELQRKANEAWQLLTDVVLQRNVESEERQEFNLPPACVFQLQMIALADDEMVKRPGAAEAYRSIARHTLELFKKP